MALYMTEKELADYLKRTGQRMPEPVPKPSSEKRSKYNNIKTEVDGETLDSRHEARIYKMLRMECKAGKHLGLGRQVPFYLPGGVKYIADFVTLEADGTYTVIDAKSEATRKDKTYCLKRKQMKNCLGINIVEV